MKITKYNLIIILTVGGLFFAALMHPNKALALSDSSSGSSGGSSTSTTDPTTDTSADTTDPTTDTTDPTTTDSTDSTTPTTDTADTTLSDPTTDPSSVDSATTTTPQCPTTDPTSNTSDPTTDPSSVDSATTTNNTDVNNCVAADSQSGDAGVSDSSVGGNATTGDSSDTANLINAVTSSGGANAQTFTDNIDGDVNGNVELDPTDFITPGDVSADPAYVDVNANNNADINNYIDLNANSGNANVENNFAGGNATTGDATTEANIVNLIDSLISDNQSFLGIININGNLDGNILIPEQLVDELLDDPSLASSLTAGASTIDQVNSTAVNNQITLAAQSGTATVSNNGVGGDATTGDATTNLNVDNLIGSQIVGGNALLVLVNVLGTWEGLILNEAPGSTSALLGGQITSYAALAPNTTITNTNTNTNEINNIINLSSTSGNATVSYNRFGGNATTGNATASVNLVNIVNSNIDLSGWLGILIINVFGTWDGSLGFQMPPATVTATTTGSSDVSSDPSSHPKVKIFYGFYTPEQSAPISLALVSTIIPKTTSLKQFMPASDKTVADTIKDTSFNYELIIGLSILLSLVTFYLTRRAERNQQQ
ncbi:MAG TPA: hypothetical protein VMR18_00195 [Candidatus Saccharimonadales bacterium]|nr:hypothetical protein [Candidatus Saccharimonadales bacterium]